MAANLTSWHSVTTFSMTLTSPVMASGITSFVYMSTMPRLGVQAGVDGAIARGKGRVVAFGVANGGGAARHKQRRGADHVAKRNRKSNRTHTRRRYRAQSWLVTAKQSERTECQRTECEWEVAFAKKEKWRKRYLTYTYLIH